MSPSTNMQRPEKAFAIIGHPVSHSLSPLLYGTSFRELKLQFSYERLDIAPEHLVDRIREFRSTLDGFNVTIPHKQSVLPLLDSITDEARSVGAVNTVVNRQGTLVGYNTDVDGIYASLATVFSGRAPAQALVLGAGGSARAVIHVLCQILHVPKITVSARRIDQAKSLADSFAQAGNAIAPLPFTPDALATATRSADLLVNTTPVGMHPHHLRCPLADSIRLHSGLTVFDLIYRPLHTVLLRRAKAAGCESLGGLEMLVQQGKRAFGLYTDREFPLEVVRRRLKLALDAEESANP